MMYGLKELLAGGSGNFSFGIMGNTKISKNPPTSVIVGSHRYGKSLYFIYCYGLLLCS